MALITLEFDFPINVSAQVGDTVYAILPTRPGVTDVADLREADITNSNVVGIINGITERLIIVDDSTGNHVFSGTYEFIMFSKDKEANTSGLLGYYMEAEFVNNSKEEAELFSVASDAIINSQ